MGVDGIQRKKCPYFSAFLPIKLVCYARNLTIYQSVYHTKELVKNDEVFRLLVDFKNHLKQFIMTWVVASSPADFFS